MVTQHMVNPSKISPTKFFLLTYIMSWTIWITLILASSQISEGVSNIVRLLGVLAPAMSALFLTLIYSGKAGVKNLFSRFKIWRVGAKWWLVAIFVYPTLLVIAGILFNLFATQSVTLMPVTIDVLIANIIFLTIATLGEEIGWRGVALPELQKKYTPLKASLILGLLWSAWHIPFWILIGTLSQYGVGYFAMNFLFIIPVTFFITWTFNNTRGSMLFPALFHVCFNVVNVAIFAVTSSVGAFAVFILLQFVMMLATIPSFRKMEYPTESLS